jgi:hypothetical protein
LQRCSPNFVDLRGAKTAKDISERSRKNAYRPLMAVEAAPRKSLLPAADHDRRCSRGDQVHPSAVRTFSINDLCSPRTPGRG